MEVHTEGVTANGEAKPHSTPSSAPKEILSQSITRYQENIKSYKGI